MFRLLFLLLFFVPNAAAQEFVIGVEEIDYLPYYQVDKQGEYGGFSRDLLDAAAEELGVTFVYRPLPIQRLYRELLSGEIDFKYPDNELWSRVDRTKYEITYSDPVVGYIDGVLLNAEADFTLEDFTKVGFVRGFGPWTLRSKIDAGEISATELNSLRSLLKLLEKGRFQGAYFNVAVAQHLSESASFQTLKFAEHLPHDKSNYRMSTLKHKELLQTLNEFLVSDEANSIRSNYGLAVN